MYMYLLCTVGLYVIYYSVTIQVEYNILGGQALRLLVDEELDLRPGEKYDRNICVDLPISMLHVSVCLTVSSKFR